MKRILFHVWRGTFHNIDDHPHSPWSLLTFTSSLMLSLSIAAVAAMELWIPLALLIAWTAFVFLIGYLRSQEMEQQP